MRYLSLTGLVAMAWFGLAVFLFIETLDFPPSLGPGRPSSAVFPQLLLFMLAILSVLVFIENLGKREQESSKSMPLRQFFSRNSTILKYCALLVFYPYLVVWLGYFVTTPFIVVLISWNLGLKNKMSITIFALGITLYVYFIFYKFLLVPFPTRLPF